MEVPQKIKYRITGNPTPGQIELSLKKTHEPALFIAALFTIAKTRKQPEYLLTDEWIKKMGCIYTQWNTTQPYKTK